LQCACYTACICFYFFIVSQTLLRIKIQNFHIYQNSKISSNFHPPSPLHHLFTSFNFLMMVCNMRQQLQILLFSLMRLGCIIRKLEKFGYLTFFFFLTFGDWNPENHFFSPKKKLKKKSLFGESSPVKKIGCLRWRWLSLLIWQSAAGSSPEWVHGHVMYMRALLFLTLQNGVYLRLFVCSFCTGCALMMAATYVLKV